MAKGKMKHDKYRKQKGGRAVLLEIYCRDCDTLLCVYQKDGPQGPLLRLYLNRIHEPDELARLQYDQTIRKPRDMPQLICGDCGQLIGTPMRNWDKRLAFRIVQGTFYKRQI